MRTRSRLVALPLNQTAVVTVTEGVNRSGHSLKSREQAEADDDKQRSHRGNRTTVRLSNGYPFIEAGECHSHRVGRVSGPLSDATAGDCRLWRLLWAPGHGV